MTNWQTNSCNVRLMARCCGGLAVAIVLGGVLLSCATPTERATRLATASGFDPYVVMGEPFRHRVFVHQSEKAVDGFHVYLGGDGTPWVNGRWVAADPTPRQPLMLQLMRLDDGRALYLGRPCYFETMLNCRPEYWTGERYSDTVVHSMAIALHHIRKRLGWRGRVTLLGYSGGGTLAMLLAPRVRGTTAVVTLAGNLDIDAWTRLHGYRALSGSLNPAADPPLPARIQQIHVVGGQDRNVPPWITRSVAARQANTRVVIYPNYTHHCCWNAVWPSVLDRLQKGRAGPTQG